MVTNITSLTGNGLKDWLIQRVSAIFIGFYIIYLLAYIFFNHPLSYNLWLSLFQNIFFQIATAIVLVMFCLHTWVGVWTVVTDYIKCAFIRLLIQIILFAVLFGQMLWGLIILWG